MARGRLASEGGDSDLEAEKHGFEVTIAAERMTIRSRLYRTSIRAA